MPLVLPVAVVVGLVAYMLNISRIFLSGHGHIPIIVGSVITVLILLGATLLSAGSDELADRPSRSSAPRSSCRSCPAGWLVDPRNLSDPADNSVAPKRIITVIADPTKIGMWPCPTRTSARC